MDSSDDERHMRALGGFSAAYPLAGRAESGPPPRVGENLEFDEHVVKTFGVVDDNVDQKELRRAAWRTWKVAGPTSGGAFNSRHLTEAREDDDLAKAIALSMQDQKASGNRDDPIVLFDDDDDDDPDLQAALAASKADADGPRKRFRSETPEEERRMMAEAIAASMVKESTPFDDDSDGDIDRLNAALEASRNEERERRKRLRLDTGSIAGSVTGSGAPSTLPSTVASSSASAEPEHRPPPLLGLGIDRAQMEKERLARQAARQNSQNANTRNSANASAGPSSRPAPSRSAASSDATSNHPYQSSGPFPRDAAGEYYLDGELRHVALKIGKKAGAPTFSLPDVFGNPKQIDFLIMSSYCWDGSFLDSGFLPRTDLCPTIRVCRPPGDKFERARKSGKLTISDEGEVHVYPDMAGQLNSTEHQKWCFIFYKTGRLRVAIMTANMVAYDWESIENTVFVQDVLPNKAGHPADWHLPDFPHQFAELFAHLKMHKAIAFLRQKHPLGGQIPISADPNFVDLGNYDWSRVKARIVISISGKYEGFDAMSKWGLGRLGQVVQEERWLPGAGERVVAEYQGSSLAKHYAMDWVRNFYQLISGNDLKSISTMPKAKSWPPMKVVFPTEATVDASIRGRDGGGTMFCGSLESFEKSRQLYHDANSKRGGVLMHTKMLIALFEPGPSPLGTSVSTKAEGKKKEKDTRSDVGGWFYVGSHNFSTAAWGTLNFKNKPPTLFIKNYELGIMLPIPRRDAQKIASAIAPHQRPPRPYGASDVPWDMEKHFND